MSNMSYCRFENTLQDLRDCNDHLSDVDSPDNEMSEYEQKARKRLIRLCHEIAKNYETEV